MRMRRSLLIAVLAAVLGSGVTLAACGSTRDPVQAAPDPSASTPAGRTYVSTGVAGHTLVDGTTVTLTFDNDGNLSVQAGCNTLGSTYTIEDGKLVVDNVAGTEMGCDAPRHAQDEWISTFLSSRPSIAAEADGLVLAQGDTTLTLVDREVAQPDKPIEGTTWVADTIIDGDSAASVPAEPKVYLRFADGKVEGSDGCNGFGGPAEVGSDTVTFGPIAFERKGCADTSPAEQPLHDLLKGEVTFEADGDRLTLTAPSGDGLGFRAG